MKKYIFCLIVLLGFNLNLCAQKIALIDMEYILKHIPTYNNATSQLDQKSKNWQNEIGTIMKEAKTMYENYQSSSSRLTTTERAKQEDAIVAKEKNASDLKKKYFGPEGELVKLRENLMKPIQNQVYNAVKSLSESYGYAIVIDRASASSIIFASPNIDISDDVLSKMGYSK